MPGEAEGNGTFANLEEAFPATAERVTDGAPIVESFPVEDAEPGSLLESSAVEQGARMNEQPIIQKDSWSRSPKSIQDQMTLEAAKQGGGRKIIDNLNDSRFKGMEKWEMSSESELGRKTNVHYVRDPKSGKLQDFKFKSHSTTPQTIKRPKG